MKQGLQWVDSGLLKERVINKQLAHELPSKLTCKFRVPWHAFCSTEIESLIDLPPFFWSGGTEMQIYNNGDAGFEKSSTSTSCSHLA
jgi:hypothetical protein